MLDHRFYRISHKILKKYHTEKKPLGTDYNLCNLTKGYLGDFGCWFFLLSVKDLRWSYLSYIPICDTDLSKQVTFDFEWD